MCRGEGKRSERCFEPGGWEQEKWVKKDTLIGLYKENNSSGVRVREGGKGWKKRGKREKKG